MSKYRIVKHREGDIIGYSPEVLENQGVKHYGHLVWNTLAGNSMIIYRDVWISTLPKTIEEAKLIIEQHIEDQKPRYSEEVVYEYDTENP